METKADSFSDNETARKNIKAYLFHRLFIRGAFVVVPPCYQQNLYNADATLISTLCLGQLKFFMLLYRKKYFICFTFGAV